MCLHCMALSRAPLKRGGKHNLHTGDHWTSSSQPAYSSYDITVKDVLIIRIYQLLLLFGYEPRWLDKVVLGRNFSSTSVFPANSYSTKCCTIVKHFSFWRYTVSFTELNSQPENPKISPDISRYTCKIWGWGCGELDWLRIGYGGWCLTTWRRIFRFVEKAAKSCHHYVSLALSAVCRNSIP